MTAIHGYPARSSVRAGEAIRLHIASSTPRVYVDFYRWGGSIQHAGSAAWTGAAAPPGQHGADWRWPAYDFPIPSDWPSGVYVAVLRAQPCDDGASALDAREGRLLFVVTPGTPTGRGILYKIPTFTYQAYNTAGGGSLYSSGQVTLRRPGGGVGGPVKGLPDPYDPHSPRQTFAHWDARFIAWMEQNGFEADFCTDLDLHEGRHLDHGHRLLLSAGHDEYWTAETRSRITAFRDAGGNIANFGANTCWWRVRLTDEATALACDKFPPAAVQHGVDPDSAHGCPDHWWETDPENTLLGVSYRGGGGHWDGHREPLGFTVMDPSHWIFDGTGLKRGDVFGIDDALVGYECDGAAYTTDARGRPHPTGEDGTPRNFSILGIAQLPDDTWNVAAREPTASPRAATLGLYSSRGTVFTAATTDWARGLATNPTIAAITRNVLRRLS
ncbi:N,N-dimethylformamidase beta subunit family domain-containing protein [Streptomyces kanamyceticus]|uniref:N,N-dimethylformamidase beta subunit-like C-terminal domain-containing protein n=1 Tax=Streptomyces kanamyceticus TaxID=1967 RepID=A0A5J6GLF4_STRKN|nr:N,N-dimethylformamidase beta subunit family domain-containing protein [Streptomyces kanamyceticus]QEU95903.1 hypothetical protein CP970_37710 [Streptomyces kanamyceticus]